MPPPSARSCLVAALGTALAVALVACTPAAPYDFPAPGTPKASPAPTYLHGVYPGGRSGEEDDLTVEDVVSYQGAVSKQAA